MFGKIIKGFLEEEDGQGISEYAAMLAFVCLLIITVFGVAQGSLEFALSQSVSSMIGQLGRLNSSVVAVNPT